MFVAIEVLRAFAGFVGTREVVEVESAGLEFAVADLVLSGRIHTDQDPPVLSQDVVDVPDVACVVTVQTVIKGYAAHVRTKFFVDPAPECRAAFKA